MANIKVRRLKDGKTGSIPEENFDPQKYAKIADLQTYQGGNPIMSGIDAVMPQGKGATQGNLLERLVSQGYSKDTDLNLGQSILRALAMPTERAFKTAGEAANVALTPGMVKSALGLSLSDDEQQQVANYEPIFLNENEIKDRGTILKEGTKTVAGLGAQMVPFGKTVPTALAFGGIQGGATAYADDKNIPVGIATGAIAQGLMRVGANKWNAFRHGNGKPVTPKTIGGSGTATQTATGQTDEVLGNIKPVDKIASEVTKKPGKSAEIMTKNWTVPTKRFNSLQPTKTAQKLIDYGIYGDNGKLAKVADTVTGENGLISGINRKAVELVGDVNVPVGDIQTALQQGIDENIMITGDIADKINDHFLSKMINEAGNTSMPASRLFDLTQQYEALGHQFLNTNTYLTGNIQNVQIGNLYLKIAKLLANKLDDVVVDSNVIQTLKTPEIISQLKDISPKLAEEFVEANSFKALRSLQSPFVKTGQIVDLTEQASLSVGNRVGTSATNLVKMFTDILSSDVKNKIKENVISKTAQGVDKLGGLMGGQTDEAASVLPGAIANPPAGNMTAPVIGLTQGGGSIPSSTDKYNQVAIKVAANAKNWPLVKQLIDQIPNDPMGESYRKAMLNIFAKDLAGVQTGAQSLLQQLTQEAQSFAQGASAKEVATRTALAETLRQLLGLQQPQQTP